MATATAIRPETAHTVSLTSNDAAILSALFDPESSLSPAISLSPAATPLPNIPLSLLPALRTREAQAIRPLNVPCPSSAAIATTITDFSALIDAYPNYAPAYLNRAQAIRLQLDSDLAESSNAALGCAAFFGPNTIPPTQTEMVDQIFSDLSAVITLATPITTTTSPPSSESTPISTSISPLQTDLLASAHTHRAYLLMKAAATISASTDTPLPTSAFSSVAAATTFPLPSRLRGMQSAQLEELASRDFALGGRYGNKVARGLSVRTNPYAKACGAIVREALKGEMEDYNKNAV